MSPNKRNSLRDVSKRAATAALLICLTRMELCLGQVQSVDESLYDAIFDGYRPELRPVFNFSQILYTDVTIGVDSILDLNSKDQALKVLARLVICWREPRISWSLSDGPEYFVVPVGSLWTPDIVIRNSLSSSPIDVSGSARPYLTYYGYACLKFFSKIETSCSVDVRKFPFDTQECQIQVSIPRSRYDKVEFGLSPGVVNIDRTEAGDWVLHGISTWVILDSNKRDSEQVMTITLTVSRQYSTHLVNTLLPLMGLFFLNPFVFITPTGHGERIGFSMSLLLSYAVTISSLSEVLPGSTEHVCYLSVMASVCFFISGFIAMVVIVISRVEDRQGDCQKTWWGVLVLHLFSQSGKHLRNSNTVHIVEAKDPDGGDHPYESPVVALGSGSGSAWQEVAMCLNRCAFWVTMALSAITVLTFLIMICA